MYYKKASLLNNRARLQRMADAKFFNGWVKEFDVEQEQFAIQVIGSHASFDSGELFMIEIHGIDRTVVCKGKVTMASEGLNAFAFASEPVNLPPRERSRIKVEGISGTLSKDGGAIDIELSDISQEGCGIICAAPLEKSTRVELLIDSPAGPIECKGHVRYCKGDSEMSDVYRIGIELEGFGRLEQARWNKMIEYSLEAA